MILYLKNNPQWTGKQILEPLLKTQYLKELVSEKVDYELMSTQILGENIFLKTKSFHFSQYYRTPENELLPFQILGS